MSEKLLEIHSREEFRDWLSQNGKSKRECWIAVKRGKPVDPNVFYYLDAVEEAICFGWIDSVQKQIDGVIYQRFSPRKNAKQWTELNKERARRLIRLGLMTPAGKKVLPPLGARSYHLDPDVEEALKKARCHSKFKAFPPLYQRVRASNVAFYKKKEPEVYAIALKRLIEATKKGEMYGEWNDYGRLLED